MSQLKAEVGDKSPETEVISSEVMSHEIFSKWSEMLSFVALSFKRYWHETRDTNE